MAEQDERVSVCDLGSELAHLGKLWWAWVVGIVSGLMWVWSEVAGWKLTPLVKALFGTLMILGMAVAPLYAMARRRKQHEAKDLARESVHGEVVVALQTGHAAALQDLARERDQVRGTLEELQESINSKPAPSVAAILKELDELTAEAGNLMPRLTPTTGAGQVDDILVRSETFARSVFGDVAAERLIDNTGLTTPHSGHVAMLQLRLHRLHELGREIRNGTIAPRRLSARSR